jgi:DNA-binding NtrC family response regulator
MRVWLPVANNAEAEGQRAAALPGGKGRVLVVDDEPTIGRTIRSALRRHEVALATSAEEALTLCRAKTFDCVVSDLMMPGMSGMDLYEALAREHPGLERRFVFITGGTVTERARAFVDRLSRPCLEKPFDLSALEDVVDQTIRDGS